MYEGAREVPPITPEATVQAAREFGILAHPIGEPSEPSEEGVKHVFATHDVRIYDPLAAVPGSVAALSIPPVPAIAPPVNNHLLSFLSSVVASTPTQPLAQQPPKQAYAYGYDYNAYSQQPAPQQQIQNPYPYNNPQANTAANSPLPTAGVNPLAAPELFVGAADPEAVASTF